MSQIPLSDIELHVETRGSGKPLLLVHGFPLDHSMWSGQLDALSAEYHVLAPDLRGFGRSGVTPGTVSMDKFADDLAQLLDVLRIDQPIAFCGLSMGGYIAWQFARRHAGRLGCLILCDTRSAGDSEEAARGRLESAASLEAEGLEGLAASMIPKLFAERTLKREPKIVDQIRGVMISAPTDGVAAALRGMAARPDMTDQLPSVTVPTLVICGQHDVISPVAEMRAIADAMPAARFVEITGAGHMAPLEQPRAVNLEILEFLTEFL